MELETEIVEKGDRYILFVTEKHFHKRKETAELHKKIIEEAHEEVGEEDE